MTINVGAPVHVPPDVRPGTPEHESGTEAGTPIVTGPQGPPGATGPVGPTGPEGPAGADGSSAEEWRTFASASNHWVITHTFPKDPNIALFDTFDNPIGGEIRWPDPTTVTVDFYYPTSGKVRLT